MSDKDELKSVDEYHATYDTFSNGFRALTERRTQKMVESFLMLYGQPAECRELRAFGQALVDGIVLFLMAEGHAALAEKWLTTEDEQVVREAERAMRGGPDSHLARPVPREEGGYH